MLLQPPSKINVCCDENNSNTIDVGSPPGSLSWTTLQYCCGVGDEEGVLALLGKGSSPNEVGKTKDGYCPLHIASRYGYDSIVVFLIDAGADVACVDVHGFTALHYAVANGHESTVKLLLERQVPIDTMSWNGNSAAELALSNAMKLLFQSHLNDEEHSFEQPKKQPSSSKENQYDKLSRWLELIALDEYLQNFISTGYDDLDFIASSGLSSQDLDVIGIKKIGHRKKLMSLYKINQIETKKRKEKSPDKESTRDDVSQNDSDDDNDNVSSNEATSNDDSISNDESYSSDNNTYIKSSSEDE